MKVAILTDVHGNLPAFEAVLKDVKRQQVDRMIILGDTVVGAPDSLACWQLAQSLDCPIIRGNNDRYVADYGTERADPTWQDEQFGPLQWVVAQLSDEEHRTLSLLPPNLQLPELPGIRFVHASLRNDVDSIHPYLSAERLDELFPQTDSTLILRGHNHLPMVNFWRERFVITVGSIGIPLDCTRMAQYSILEYRPGKMQPAWQIFPQAVSYDVDATLARFSQTGYLDQAGPIARLFQHEILTGTYQLHPFFRVSQQWADRDQMTLSQAVDRFLP